MSPLPPPQPDPTDVHQRITTILARPEFHRAGPSLAQRLLNWVQDLLARLVDAIAGSAGGGLVGTVLLLAAVAIVVLLVIRLTRSVQTDPRAPGPDIEEHELRPPQDWRREAEDHERAGRWRAGLRCRYRALVGDLAGRGVLVEVPGRTTGEERAEVVAGAPAAAPAFGRATEIFEGAWYGNVPVGEPDVAQFRELADRTLQELAR